jgi:hypothetical protein
MRLTSRRSQPPLALAVPLSRFTSQVGGGSAFFVRQQLIMKTFLVVCLFLLAGVIGYFLPTPISPHLPGYFQSVRYVDAAVSALLGVLVWSVYHLVEPVHYGKRWLILRATVIPTAWFFLIVLFYTLFGYLMTKDWKLYEPLMIS